VVNIQFIKIYCLFDGYRFIVERRFARPNDQGGSPMPDRSKGKSQTKCNHWSSRSGVWREATTPPRENFAVTEPPEIKPDGTNHAKALDRILWRIIVEEIKIHTDFSASKDEMYFFLLSNRMYNYLPLVFSLFGMNTTRMKP
jgi:hypothetical protein